MIFLLVCFVSLFALTHSKCPSTVMCPGNFWLTDKPGLVLPITDELDISGTSCVMEGKSMWFLLKVKSDNDEILLQMQARTDIDVTNKEIIDWAAYKIPDNGQCNSQMGDAVAKGCTNQSGGVYDLPALSAKAGDRFIVLVRSVKPVSIKVSDLSVTQDSFDCDGVIKFTSQTAIHTAFSDHLPTNAPTSAPTNAPTWPAHQFVPKIVPHDPWYLAYTNAPTPAGPVEYNIPAPVSPNYVPAKPGKTVFKSCIGFGHLCNAPANHLN